MKSAFVSMSESVNRGEELYRPHPGDVFKRRCLSKTILKHREVADRLCMSARHLSRFFNGHVTVIIDLARKLESVTNISATAWHFYQNAYDLYLTAD